MARTIPAKVIIVSPTESVLTKRGDRHPLLARMLTDRNCELLYVTTDIYHAEKRKFSGDEIENAISSVEYRMQVLTTCVYQENTSVKRLFGNIYTATKLLLFLLKVCSKADVLVVPSRPPEIVLAAFLLKRLKSCRLVVDVRDVWPEGLPLGKSRREKLFASYCRCIFSMSRNCGDHYVYTAPAFEDWLSNYADKRSRTFIPLGFEEKRWSGSRPLSNSDLMEGIRIAYVGDVAKTMNIVPFVESVTGSAKCSLTFVGGGEFLDDIKSMVRSQGAENVDFVGFVPKERVVQLMRTIHISVIPMGGKYVMPNKLFDALGAYRPLLVLGANDAANFVKEYDIGWVMPFDQDAISDCLNVIDPQEVIEKSKNIAQMRDKFKKELLYERFSDIVLS